MYGQQQQRHPHQGGYHPNTQQIAAQQHQQLRAQQQQQQQAAMAQQQQQQQQKRQAPGYWDVLGSNEGFQRAKRPTPTDRVLPPFPASPPPLTADEGSAASRETQERLHRLASSYTSLQDAERKLDWTISRKRVELREAIEMGQTVKRTLRLKLWNTVSGQKWQQQGAKKLAEGEADAEGEGKEDAMETATPPKPAESSQDGGGIPGLRMSSPDKAEGQANGTAGEKLMEEADGVDFSTGEGVPQWTFHIEGHLLDPSISLPAHAPSIAESPRPFSTLIKALVIRIDRPDGLHPEPNSAEWQAPSSVPIPPNPPNPNPPTTYPSFSLTRTGAENVRVQVALHLDQQPERIKVNPVLGHFLDVQEESLPGIVQALWAYIKRERLQDSDDKRLIRKDQNLAYVFGNRGGDKIPFHFLEDMAKGFVSPAEPLQLTYEVKVDESSADSAQYYDIEVEIADPARLQMKKVDESLGGNDSVSRQIRTLDEEIADSVARIKEAQKRREFFSSFSDDPVSFLSTWLSSQSADLETLLGRDRGYDAAAAGGIRGDQMRAAEFFNQPWANEGIALYESRSFAQKVAEVGGRR